MVSAEIRRHILWDNIRTWEIVKQAFSAESRQQICHEDWLCWSEFEKNVVTDGDFPERKAIDRLVA